MRQKITGWLLTGGVLFALPCILTLIIRKNIPETDTLAFDSGILVYINHGYSMESMDFEEYLIGVTGSQIPQDYPLEAVRAQAVIARTHMMGIIGDRSSITASELGEEYLSRDAFLEKWGNGGKEAYENLIQAVTDTQEEVLTYEGELTEPVFFYSGTGKTRNALDVWGSAIPYLVCVESPEPEGGDQGGENQTQIVLDAADCIQRLKASDEDFEAMEDTFKDSVQILQKDDSGYVLSIQMGNKTFSGEALRQALDLPSAAFDVSAKRKTVTFTVTGSGHGVGLSQQGAKTLAEEGKGYDEILSWYFPGTVLE